MNRNFRGAAFAAAPFFFGSAAQAQWSSGLTSPRNAVVDAGGARTVQVEAGAGTLRIEGRAGLRQVQVRGTARSPSQAVLNQIKLISERRGDVVFIKTDIPEQDSRDWNDNRWAALDLVIEVPQGINADITDGSGEMEIVNVGSVDATDGSGSVSIKGAAEVTLDDNSGEITIDNIRGDVRVSDGSGDINVRNVSGSFTVKRDGSGSITASDIRGSVIVQQDGSGGIEATKIGRNFTVGSKGSGSIDFREVSGQVDIPDRKRRHRGREDDDNR